MGLRLPLPSERLPGLLEEFVAGSMFAPRVRSSSIPPMELTTSSKSSLPNDLTARGAGITKLDEVPVSKGPLALHPDCCAYQSSPVSCWVLVPPQLGEQAWEGLYLEPQACPSMDAQNHRCYPCNIGIASLNYKIVSIACVRKGFTLSPWFGRVARAKNFGLGSACICL